MEKHISSKLRLCLTALLVVLFFVTPKSVLATDYYVAGDTGNDTTGNGSISTPWKTIQKAADTMVAGDTVNVKGELTYAGDNTCATDHVVVCINTNSGSDGLPITYQNWSGTGIPIIDALGRVSGIKIRKNYRFWF